MFSRTQTQTFTGASSHQAQRLKQAIEQADAIVIGAGAGLSASAGFIYTGERFEQYFSDFARKYGFRDMYTGGFFPYAAPEEYWAYWSRYILINRYMDAPKPVYNTLLQLVSKRDYFVLTTNVDHCFQKAGFDKTRLFYTQGDYGLFQCSVPCCGETFDNQDAIRAMAAQQKNMRIPTSLLPICPRCGRPLIPNLRADDKFAEDSGWHAAAARYQDFLHRHQSGRILFLELGVGFNTPGIIKYPFWRMTAANPSATYACINYEEALCPSDIARRSICINGDIGTVLAGLSPGDKGDAVPFGRASERTAGASFRAAQEKYGCTRRGRYV